MQCPSCGFENIPGRQECGVCAASLVVARGRESVMPPRAKNRTVRQRVRWWLDANIHLGLRLEAVRCRRDLLRGVFRGSLQDTRARWSWLSLRGLGLFLISVIPGFGYIFARRDKRTGFRHLLACALALGLAMALIRTPVADGLVYGVLAASVISMTVAAESLFPAFISDESRVRMRLGAALMSISLLMGGYFLLQMAVYPALSTAAIMHNPATNLVAEGDVLLLWGRGAIDRGDLIIGNAPGREAGLGIVVGVAGDRVRIARDGRVSVNGAPIRSLQETPLAHMENLSQIAEGTLSTDQYLVA